MSRSSAEIRTALETNLGNRTIPSAEEVIEESRQHNIITSVNRKAASIMVRSGSVAFQSLLLGMHLAANSKMLSMLSDEETGAGSIVSTFQSVVLGTAGGFLLATGIELGKPIATSDFEKAGHIAKSSWVLALALGGLSTVTMAATPLIFPLLFSKDASDIAIDFFKGYAACGIPSAIMMSSPHIAFQAGEEYVPFAVGAMFYIPAGAMSYLLAFPGGMGAIGIGLGGSIAGWLSTIGVQCWLSRRYYEKYQLYQWPIANLKSNLSNLLKTGFQLSLQRLTEWANLFAITTVIGASSANALAATSPAIQYTSVFALSMQGLAQATAMLIISNKESISNNAELCKKNTQTLVVNNVAGGVLGIAAAILCYVEREPLSNFFLAPGTAPEIKEMAETFLWINMLSSMPDAIRIISLGALRGWKDVYMPTFFCLALMTMIGVPVGYGASEAQEEDWSYMFIIRDIAITLSAMMMVWRCRKRIQNDKREFIESQERADNTAQIQDYGTNHSDNHVEQNQSEVSVQSDRRSESMLFGFSFFRSKKEGENKSLLVEQAGKAKKSILEF